MLGRLFSAASSSLNAASYGRDSDSLESSLEQQHTAALLFSPTTILHSDINDFYPPPGSRTSPSSRAGAFDDRGGLDLDATDLRIIIAQDAFADQDKPCVLLDTKPIETPSGQKTTSGPAQGTWQTHARGSPSAFSPRNPPTSPLGNQKHRTSLPMPAHTSQGRNRSTTISIPSAAAIRDHDTKDGVNSFLDCMFGATSSARSSSSTKMHVISSNRPGSTRIPDALVRSPVTQETPVARAPPLSRAQTASNAPAILKTKGPAEDSAGDTLLITRTFSVNLPETSDVAATSGNDSAKTPESASSSSSIDQRLSGQKRPKLRETKTPAFAVAFVIQLPRSTESRPVSRHSRTTSMSPALSSSFSSSVGSDMHSSWTFVDALPLSLGSSQSMGDNIDCRLEMLVAHWDVLVRTLALLEHQASIKIYELLREVHDKSKGQTTKTPKEKAMQRTNQKVVQLGPWALTGIQKLRESCVHTIRRLSRVLRIPQVVTGLGLLPGGHWLEEARTVSRFCRAQQQSSFLYCLLTAFLGDHVQWIELLDTSEREQSQRLRKAFTKKSDLLASRSVLVCSQRSLARRLIYLLASFLPSQMNTLAEVAQDGRTSRNSPAQTPLGNSLNRRESLRRTINRRARDGRANADIESPREFSANNSSNEIIGKVGPSGDQIGDRPTLPRKGSKTASSLSIPTDDPIIRKSSATATSTASPDPATPIPYFVSGSQSRDSYFPAVMSSEGIDSSASADLARILRRNSSSFGPSTGSTKWGSLLSGFWSGKADSANTSNTAVASVTQDSVRRSSIDTPKNAGTRTRFAPEHTKVTAPEAIALSASAEHEGNFDAARPTGSISIPPRLKVDSRDGVVDVDLNIPGFLSFSNDKRDGLASGHQASSMQSLDGASSVRSLRSHAQISHQPNSTDSLNVAGYLQHYHEDFTLQAVRPYHEMMEDIKKSMSSERIPERGSFAGSRSSSDDGTDHWDKVCTTLIADVQNFTVKRLTLKRKTPSSNLQQGPNSSKVRAPSSPSEGALPSPISRQSSYYVQPPEEMFSEEVVTDFDPTLANAIGRALSEPFAIRSRTASPSRTHSRTVSTSTTASVTRTEGVTSSSSLQSTQVGADFGDTRRDSRQVVVGALEEVVKSVNEDLHRHENGRDVQNLQTPRSKLEPKQKTEENALREGVKRWLIGAQEREVW